MYQKVVILFFVLLCSTLVPANATPKIAPVHSTITEPVQAEGAKQKRLLKRVRKKHTDRKMGQPVLPAIAMSLGIIAVVVFILAGLPGIFIGLAAIVVGSVVLTRRNGYDRKDRIMARVGVLLGSLFSILGLVILLALFDIFVIEGEFFESLYEHTLG